MTERYAILRDLSREPLGGPLSGGLDGPFGMAEPGPPHPAPVVEEADLSPKDLRDVARETGVAAVAPDMEIMPIAPLDTGEAEAGPAAGGNSWGIEAVLAHQSPFTGQGVKVAVIDSGIDAAHPAFQGVDLVQQDFSGSGDGDSSGHGTHCAGTIFGQDVGGTRIGVARGVDRALIGRVFGTAGGGSSLTLYQAMQWAAQGGANIISMSLGYDFVGMANRLEQRGFARPAAVSAAMSALVANLRFFDRLMAMLKASQFMGIDTLVIAASGNESNRPSFEVTAALPSAADGVVSVGAVGPASGGVHPVARFSNANPNVVAPGVDVVSARANAPGLVAMSGTSMATPHVAGIAALWWQAIASAAPGLPVAPRVADRLRAGARRNLLGSPDDPGDYGEGLVTAPLA
ncbi:MAG: S8 family serine peptidase [Thermaurantiacus sp.]